MERKKEILVIEQDKNIHEAYKEIFDAQKYHIISAHNAQDGIAISKILSPNIVILSMELGSPEQTLKELKQNSGNTPIIAVGGKEADRSQIQSFSNVYRYFLKPLSLKNLLKAVTEVLQQTSLNSNEVSQKGVIEIENFEFEKFLGQGAYGKVYKGQYLGEETAIKILRKSDLSSEKISRFQREVFALASIEHENIIELLHTGVTKENYYYMITKYFPGENLETLLKKHGKFPPKDATEIAIQVAEGLTEAHKENLIHRDIKPSNILYSPKLRKVKIIDFGLVRLHGYKKTITQKGMALGTPYYMSPEQCKTKKANHFSDIYNLGATFYHLLTGVPPFVKRSIFEIMVAHEKAKVTFPKNFNANLASIIEKMMAKKPTNRYPSMHDVAEVLKQTVTTL
ncbi:protein kinase domain-containing protein [Candidatus Uabimicrobium amorphum]|uniref:Protein kinase n=1 Tax=Uabimicrobium amorphum TaxID=2596890 RepID=A0A5S9II93_UABAM|nr:protein kinase [Candidatus Uabimicrobium amorphum]BBM81881.1 protein kinase [Candidatus Uabimicrobium amorphum]